MKEKLLAIQQELKAPKNQYNSFGKYKYRNAEDILEAVKPLLKKYELVLTLTDELQHIGNRYYVKATATLSNGEVIDQVSAYAREDEAQKGMQGAQITGSSSSYARKYALNGLFLIDDTKDSDATNDHKPDEDKLIADLNAELGKYKDPQKLDKDKQKIRDKYVELGLKKDVATNLVQEVLNAF